MLITRIYIFVQQQPPAPTEHDIIQDIQKGFVEIGRIAPRAAVEKENLEGKMLSSSVAEDTTVQFIYRVSLVQIIRRAKKGQCHHRYGKIFAHSGHHMLSLCKSKCTNANISRIHSAHTFHILASRKRAKLQTNSSVG